MAYKRSPRMEEKLTENRERILLAARQLVAEGGYRNAPMATVAAAAGVSTGLIYRHFRSRTALFVEVLDVAVSHELSLLRAITAEDAPAAQRLRRAIAAFVRRALAGPGLAYAFIAEPSDPEVEAARLRGRQQLAQLFAQLLAAGVATGEFAEQDLDVAAACIVGAFTEAMVGPLAPGRVSAQDEQQLVTAICNFCLRAVAAGV